MYHITKNIPSISLGIFLPISLFGFYGYPDFAGIIGIFHIGGGISLYLRAARVFIVALREKFRADSSVCLAESVGHSAFHLENRIGICRYLNNLKITRRHTAVIFRTYAIVKFAVGHRV